MPESSGAPSREHLNPTISRAARTIFHPWKGEIAMNDHASYIGEHERELRDLMDEGFGCPRREWC